MMSFWCQTWPLSRQLANGCVLEERLLRFHVSGWTNFTHLHCVLDVARVQIDDIGCLCIMTRGVFSFILTSAIRSHHMRMPPENSCHDLNAVAPTDAKLKNQSHGPQWQKLGPARFMRQSRRIAHPQKKAPLRVVLGHQRVQLLEDASRLQHQRQVSQAGALAAPAQRQRRRFQST